MEFLNDASEWFWDPTFWLPNNLSWADLQDTDDAKFPHMDAIYESLLVAIFLWILKQLLVKFVLIPYGISQGIKHVKLKRFETNKVLEIEFRSCNRPDHKSIQGYAKKLQWSERQVERWFRKRRQRNKLSTLTKFYENGWRFVFHLLSLIYSLWCLWDKEWLWDTLKCWENYPQSLEKELKLIYVVQMGFYILETVEQMNNKSSDFLLMLFHHFITFAIILFSWVIDFARIGVVIMLIFTCADVVIRLAKMMGYLNRKLLGTIIFFVLVIVWLATRVVLFMITSYTAIYRFPLPLPIQYISAYHVFQFLILSLLVMQLFWTYGIVKLALTAILSRKILEKDYRSETESISSTE